MELIEALNKLGFTRHEAVLYLTLCQEGDLTGYEAAKQSGIPRSNAYLALAGLVDKGGAYKVESEAARYNAAPVRELAANLRRGWEATLEFLIHNVPTRNAIAHPYITITGSTQILHKMKNLIDLAGERIYLSLASSHLTKLQIELETAVKRGLKVVLITDSPFELENATHYQHHQSGNQIRLITDTTHVLTGELTEAPNTACLYSTNPNLVELIKDSLTNEIELIRLKTPQE